MSTHNICFHAEIIFSNTPSYLELRSLKLSDIFLPYIISVAYQIYVP